MQHFTTPTLNTKGKTSLDCPVVHLERELINNYLSQFFKDGCIALPANQEVLHDLSAKDFHYLILRVAFHQSSDNQLVHTAIAMVPSNTWTEQGEKIPVASETLKQLALDITTNHNIKHFLYTRPGKISQLLDAQGTVQDELIAPPAELHIRHFRKLYDCDAFVEFYLNEYPQGVSSAYNRRGELFQRAKKWDKMTQLKNR